MLPLTPDTDQTNPSHAAGRSRLRRATAVGLTAGLLGGGAAGLLFAVPSLTSAAGTAAVAQTSDSSTDSGTNILDSTDEASTDTPDTPAGDADRPDRGAMVRERLQSLVDDGTITAEQADAVAAHLAAGMPDGRGGHGGPGGIGRGGFGRGDGGTVVADALGITVDELRTALQSGQSIADVAAAEGVDVQVVIDAVIAEATTHLDEHVADGSLTQAEADARLAELTAAITERVNTAGELGGRMGGGMGGRGHRDTATDTGTDTATGTATDA